MRAVKAFVLRKVQARMLSFVIIGLFMVVLVTDGLISLVVFEVALILLTWNWWLDVQERKPKAH